MLSVDEYIYENLDNHQEIVDIEVIDKNRLLIKIEGFDRIKALIYNLKEKKIIEIGPGKILSGLIKRISNAFDIISIDKVDDLKKLNNYEQN